MGGKGGGGASIPREVEEAARVLQDIGRQQFELGLPFVEQGIEDAQAVLRGEVPASLRPAILQTLEEGRRSAGEQVQQVEEFAAQTGITGTALQEALSEATLLGEQTVAAIPSQFLNPVLQDVSGQLFGQTQAGLQSLGAAATAGASAAIPGRQAGGLLGGLGGAASGALAGSAFGPVGAGIGGFLGLLGGAK